MDILTSKEKGIITITFNRPGKKNAITAAMYQAMADALKDAEGDHSVRVIVITGSSEIFTAGNDLDDFLNNPAQGDDTPVSRFMRQLSGASKPVIAAIFGSAIGIGSTLLLHCDLVYAADNARFSLPFARLGLCPEFSSSLLLPQMVGHHRAAEKLMLGEFFSAEEACGMGLVNRVLPADELTSFVRAQAEKLSALPATSLRTTKRLMKGNQAQVEAKMREEGRLFGELLLSREAKEAFSAFLEKRKPDFTKFS
jgi:enoyl-CoA hydratase/carnithine racemase